MVYVRLRDGTESDVPKDVEEWDWRNHGRNYTIVAYKIAE